MSDIMVVEHVAKRYRRTASGTRRSVRHLNELWGGDVHWALQDVSFTVRDGESVGLIGVNGSGKSTLLRIISGLSRPTRGTVTLRRRVSGLLTLGDSFQGDLSASENALTGAILGGLTKRAARARLDDIAAFAELEDVMDVPLRTFSDGMRLRLAFAIAINVDPEILLVDEVLAVGDLRFRQKCIRHLEALEAAGVTVVVSSHELEQVERLCERAIWLANGKVRADGPAAMVAEQYRQAMESQLAAMTSDADGFTRIGERQVEIAQVRLLTTGSAATGSAGTVASGAGMTVEIDYQVNEPVPDAIFGVSAHTEEGHVRCFDVNTIHDGLGIGPLTGKGSVRLRIDRLDLSPGLYRLDVGIYEPSFAYPYDYQWAAYPFEVSGRPTDGVLSPPRRWELDD